MSARHCLLALLLSLSVMACGKPSNLHPSFRLTAKELAAATAALPDEVRARIAERPADFLGLVLGALQEPPELLTLVDKGHALPADSVPPDLVPVEEAAGAAGGRALKAARPGFTLRRALLQDLVIMAESAREEGIELVVSSAYRSYEYQVQLFERNAREMGLEEAGRASARAGHSQHQLGTAIDFGSIDDSFADTAAGRWLARKAWLFGFSLSYPRDGERETGYRYEPWHYRWVGRPAGRLIAEYFLGRQQMFLEYWGASGSFYREKVVR